MQQPAGKNKQPESFSSLPVSGAVATVRERVEEDRWDPLPSELSANPSPEPSRREAEKAPTDPPQKTPSGPPVSAGLPGYGVRSNSPDESARLVAARTEIGVGAPSSTPPSAASNERLETPPQASVAPPVPELPPVPSVRPPVVLSVKPPGAQAPAPDSDRSFTWKIAALGVLAGSALAWLASTLR